MKKIGRKVLEDLIKKESEFKLINVLSRESFGKVHISGSINIPFLEEDFAGRFASRVVDQNEMVIVYCASPS